LRTVVWSTQIFTDGDKVAQALEVVWVFRVDLLVQLQRFLVVVHAPVARGHHQAPFHLVRLNLRGAVEEVDGFLVQL
jgi:hypothetical protein